MSLLQTATDTPITQPLSPALAERERRERLRERAAWALYESLRLCTMPAWDELPSVSRMRLRNAITIGAKSIDMTRLMREGR